MSQFSSYSEVLDKFVKNYFSNVSIFSSIHPENTLFKDTVPYYKFQISEQKRRKNKRLKKDFPNTKATYEQIKKDFTNHKQITSLDYKVKKVYQEYRGIKIENNQKENLEIYFSRSQTVDLQKEIEHFNKLKLYDFYRYARKPIKKDIVNKMTIRPSFKGSSQVLYILNNLEIPSLLKENYLGYYYKEDDIIDYFVISELIRYFINSHLEENPKYIYNENAEYQTVSLHIVFDSGKIIEIIGTHLIDFLEKNRLIDDLYNLNKEEITKMPKTKILKKEGLK